MIGSWLREHFSDVALLGVGHRVVHGGIDYAAPVWVEPAVLAKLEALSPLAPLHRPHNLAGIRAVAAVQPDLPQVACFDTAFHRGHPELADWFALPRRFYDEGIRRYGFHGLSYEYIAISISRCSDTAYAPPLRAGTRRTTSVWTRDSRRSWWWSTGPTSRSTPGRQGPLGQGRRFGLADS